MKKKINTRNLKPINPWFIRAYYNDSLYPTIVKEISKATDTKKRGRKISLTAEKLHNFLFYLSIGLDYKEASESAFIPENTRQKYMVSSETFRRVASLARENLGIVSRMALTRAIEGRKPDYYAFTHPITKETIYLLLDEIQPNPKAAMWYLDKVKYFEKYENKHKKNENSIGSPQNEHEAQLLEQLLNRHYDYIQKRAKS